MSAPILCFCDNLCSVLPYNLAAVAADHVHWRCTDPGSVHTGGGYCPSSSMLYDAWARANLQQPPALNMHNRESQISERIAYAYGNWYLPLHSGNHFVLRCLERIERRTSCETSTCSKTLLTRMRVVPTCTGLCRAAAGTRSV